MAFAAPRRRGGAAWAGLVNHQSGRQHEALGLLRQAVRAAGNGVSPAKAAEYRANLAAVLGRLGRHAEAAAELAEVVRVRPDYPEGHCNLGVALEHSGRKEEAAAAYRRAIALRPEYAQAFNSLGNCLRKMQRVDEAESAYRQAVRLKPGHAGAYNNLAIVLSGQGWLAEVIECRRKVAELRPGSAAAGSALLSTLHYAAASTPGMLLEMAREWSLRLTGDASSPIGRSEVPGSTEPGGGSTKSEARSTKQIQSTNSKIRNQDGPSPQPSPGVPGEGEKSAVPDGNGVAAHRLHGNDRDPGRRLRVGFVSSNLSGHPEGRFLRPLLANLNREAFETTCYSAGPRADAVTALLRQLCDRWRDIRRMSDEHVAAGIRQDRIDILVDLTGHFGGNRLGIFARKPAPVQVIHFGYPGTSGMAAMDWRVTDEYADPFDGKHEIRNSISEIDSKSEGEMTETGMEDALPGHSGDAGKHEIQSSKSETNWKSQINSKSAVETTGTTGSGIEMRDKPGAQRSGAPDGGCERHELHGDREASGAPLRCARGLSEVAESLDEIEPGGNGSSVTKTPTLPSSGAGVPWEGNESAEAPPLAASQTNPAAPPGISSHGTPLPYTTEKLLRLLVLAWVYDEPLEARAAGALPAQRNGYVTFLCANNPLKVTPEAVAAWAQILAGVPNSRLTMLLDEKGPQSARRERLAGGGDDRGNGDPRPSPQPSPGVPGEGERDAIAGRWLRVAFASRGIDPARVGFAGRQSRGAYFAWIESADIALDPFPYNGGVTTCDTLWMGVPVISLVGDAY